MPSLHSFLTSLLGQFQELDIRYCILRNYQELPHDNGGRDIDILIPAADNGMAIRAIGAISGVTLTGLTRRANMTAVYVHGVLWGKDHEAIEIDLITARTWKGFEYLSAERILDNSIAPFSNRPLIRTPAPYHEAIISFLGTYLITGDIKDKYRNFIFDVFSHSRQETTQELQFSLGPALAEKLIRTVLADNKEQTKQLRAPVIRKIINYNLQVRPWNSLRQFFRHMYTELNLFVRGGGSISIAFLGPDGAGKTTILNALTARLQYVANRVDVVHLKPVFFLKKRNASRGVVTEPHSKPKRSTFTSVLKLVLWITEAWIDGTICRQKSFNVKIFDRYYDDILIDPQRYRYGAPLWIVKLGRFFIPKPDLYIVLIAPPDVIQLRKQEVSREETERQVRNYKLLAQKLGGVLVNSDNQIDAICENILFHVLETMKARITTEKLND
ncbi:MAG: hypothetical protein KJ804_10970 [Proteobacteria bacterium]|nr:hypothetical protein [Pseudomonadota bacterium]MBU1058826.1 hypothetical protein [Pseudomonadota bacterium]